MQSSVLMGLNVDMTDESVTLTANQGTQKPYINVPMIN